MARVIIFLNPAAGTTAADIMTTFAFSCGGCDACVDVSGCSSFNLPPATAPLCVLSVLARGIFFFNSAAGTTAADIMTTFAFSCGGCGACVDVSG
ncbi:MAG TPA: hypothetical protein PLB42_07270 [Kiritimatiellia bacterium]|nr:hypothetical protein [Kiritimatiellia bacterium]